MFVAHSFRLRPPWDCEPVNAERLCWQRVFHRPTGLEKTDQLWLVVSGLPADGHVWLNDQRLAPPEGRPLGQFEVTGLVEETSRIAIEMRGSEGDDFPLDVRLAIVGNE